LNSSEELLLTTALEDLSITCSRDQVSAFSIYLSLLKKWSMAYNLTSLNDNRDIIVKHFIDSVSYLKAIPAHARTVLDVGSGAGFPGIPLKIMRPSFNVVLLEPSRKKVSFLMRVVSDLSLEHAQIVRGRIEEYPCSRDDVPGQFDVVTTRALFSTEELIRLASPFCVDNGTIVLSKGPSYREELRDLEGYSIRVEKVNLARFGLDRYLVIAAPCKCR